ncbi:hypothetical protein JTE90_025510 [Oedothorax gibbosus]|uniref:Uncharacterized protein n=1 Tax=Oedothorax gibbosus TaxID=931172 RepID=A0AAV6TTV4_9ARAC|nr:hypothetical protein JTE90_025510 [Oedothorax gibbosus]
MSYLRCQLRKRNQTLLVNKGKASRLINHHSSYLSDVFNICSFENMDAIPTKSSSRRYERDFLLQLRLHPFSLQKPKSLKDLEIIKDKLYLHQVDNNFGSNGNNSLNLRTVYQGTMKPDSESMFRTSRIFSNYYSRNGPLYSSSYKPNSGYYGAPTKSRSFYLPYNINPARKFPVSTAADYKFDLFDDAFSSNWPASQTAVPFSKRTSYEDMWNYYNGSTQNNHDVAIKSKKALPIIDPSNGKNILEGIIKVSPASTSQESIGESGSDAKDSEPLSSADELACEKTEDSDGTQSNEYVVENMESRQDIHDINMISGESELKERPLKDIQFEDNTEMDDGLNTAKEKTSETSSVDFPTKQQMHDYEDKSNNTCEDFLTANDKNSDKENHNSYSMLYNSRDNSNFCSIDASLRTEEQLKQALLKERVYAMRQEQQKMVAYESFLRYKSRQLNEMIRSLDSKKFENTNWERNLISKEKQLKEMESWLEYKKNDLKNKEEGLREREKKLNAMSIEFQLNGGSSAGSTEGVNNNSNETPNSLNGSKLSKYVSKFAGRNLAESAEDYVPQLIGDEKGVGNLDKDIEGSKAFDCGISAFSKVVGAKRNYCKRNGLVDSPENAVGYPEMNGECFE